MPSVTPPSVPNQNGLRLKAVAGHLRQERTWFPLLIALAMTMDHWLQPRTGWTAALLWVYGAMAGILLGYLVKDLCAVWRAVGAANPLATTESLNAESRTQDNQPS